MPNWRVDHGLLVGLPIDSSSHPAAGLWAAGEVAGPRESPPRLGKVPEECADMSTQQQLILHGLNSI